MVHRPEWRYNPRVPDFKRLYLDTTVLRKSNWPHISAELSFLLESARNFGIEVFLPEVVEREREAQWFRDFTAASQKLDAAADKLAVSLGAVGADRAAIPNQNLDALKARYRTQADEEKARGGIRTVPITARPITELLKMAVERIPPFQQAGDKVTGFQDTLILFSIIDDAKAAGATICAIVSDDDVFSKIDHIARAERVILKHFRNTHDVWKLLVDEIAPNVVEWRNQQRAEIRRALEFQSDQIIELLRKKVAPEMVDSRVEKIEAIKRLEVLEVDMPLPAFPNEPGPYRTVEGATFRVAVKVGVEFDASARPGFSGVLAASFFRRLTEGSAGKMESEPSMKEEPRPETFWKKAQLEANAVFLGDHLYLGDQYRIDDLQFVRIE
jgi:predicted nuclease with RNAse H fold